ncbi:YdcF family protein [Niallia sp. NCCP-28]|uniref:YdcF family protein n=1 Tax=Niallia sp. NCCP-28 TaxID=2934712 RepID=UPI0020838A9C|nr:YdcF family protein [Niallia sp. NCCP-28]GKU80853.1 hypothetical protein NCCP28_02490 [Niallia sp. NCCP-28]
MKKLFYLAISLVVACFGMVAFYYIQIKQTAAIPPPNNIPYIIVLGAKANEQKLSKPLKYRAETAFAYWEKNQKSQIVVTGGQGKGETTTEAEALQNFFLKKGVPENRILVENKSTSTYENIQFAKKLFAIEEAVIVSNDFHLFRATTIAKKEGIQAYPLAAKTPFWAKLPLYAREYAAIGKMKLKGY